jgi:hypothetical protein
MKNNIFWTGRKRTSSRPTASKQPARHAPPDEEAECMEAATQRIVAQMVTWIAARAEAKNAVFEAAGDSQMPKRVPHRRSRRQPVRPALRARTSRPGGLGLGLRTRARTRTRTRARARAPRATGQSGVCRGAAAWLGRAVGGIAACASVRPRAERSRRSSPSHLPWRCDVAGARPQSRTRGNAERYLRRASKAW